MQVEQLVTSDLQQMASDVVAKALRAGASDAGVSWGAFGQHFVFGLFG
jgi:hypothetical protein